MNAEERRKNKRLTDFDDLREFVIANAVKNTVVFKKQKTAEQSRLIQEF